MVKAARRLAFALALLLGLTGCMYGGQVQNGTPGPDGEYIPVVQQAVDNYRSQYGVLPIRTKGADTPVYERYIVDFRKLKDTNMIANLPTDAFERGGSFQYILIDPETKPVVKLVDLRTVQAVIEMQRNVDEYKRQHGGSLPAGEEVSPGFHLIDFGKLHTKDPGVKSPYADSVRPMVMNAKGEVGIDYSPDISVMLAEKSGEFPANVKNDLRRLLLDSSFYAPARSFTYRLSGEMVTLSQS